MADSYSMQPASAYCYNCGDKGHYGFECSERRMFGGTFPTFPFIYYYDNEYDIKRSLQRAKKKVQELQEAGFLPKTPKRPHRDYVQEEHKHKKKREVWKEHGKRGHHNLRKRSHADLVRERKRKKDVQNNYMIEECFPRGGHQNTHKKCRRKSPHHQSVGFLAEGKTENHRVSMESGKKRKRKKKQRSHTKNSCPRDESLFLIKQKKKKMTPKASLI